jgi:aspartate 1-decarboxylase
MKCWRSSASAKAKFWQCGAAAFQGKKGDLLTIMTFAQIGNGLVKRWKPRVIVLGKSNRIVGEPGIWPSVG